ncbi:MAG: lipocalin family protein [Pseudomonadota bacterium]
MATAQRESDIRTAPPVYAVENVDVTRYMGTWHEVALFPNKFQAQCIADTTAIYTLQQNGRIEVRNRCKMENGTFDEVIGEAKFAGNDSKAKLKVRFAPWFLSWLPQVWGDYWVIELEPSYRYAIVSEPSRKFLWILSRTPKLSDETLAGIKTRLTMKGYDVRKLQFKPQGV